LPDAILISAVTLGELSFGPHATDDPAKRAGRVAVLQHAEATFDPLPYDQGAARLYGQICAAVRAAGRQPRKRSSELQIAAAAGGRRSCWLRGIRQVNGTGGMKGLSRRRSNVFALYLQERAKAEKQGRD
jgi:hypothetical protein